MTGIAKLVKELRNETGAGLMDCKKALFECDMDMDKARKWLKYNWSPICIMDNPRPPRYDPVTDTVNEEE